MCAKKKRRSGLSDADKASARLVALYEAAERDIAARITKALAATDGDKNKLTIRALEQQHKAVKKILRQLLAKTRKPVREIVNSAFSGGLAVARKELKDAGITDVVLEMGGINAKAMAVYSEQVYSRMADVVQQANRTTTDIYQALKLNTSLGGAVGGYDAIGNVRRNMQKVSEDAGITAFIDKRGRSWSMASYTDMLCRTSTMQIYHQAKTNEFLAHGEDLVIVSSHTPTCDKCAPWNGKILSLTGETPGYPTMAEAEAAGLFHPNCRHTYGLYIEDDAAREPDNAKNAKAAEDKEDTSAPVHVKEKPDAAATKALEEVTPWGEDQSRAEYTRGHLGPGELTAEVIKQDFEKAGRKISDEEAEATRDAIRKFTQNDFTPIRAAQKENVTTSPYYKKGELIENWLEIAPIYPPHRNLCRGICGDDAYERLSLLAPGAEFADKTLMSASSKLSVAESFSTQYGERPVLVIIRGGVPYCSSIRGASALPDEYEVLVSKRAVFEVFSKEERKLHKYDKDETLVLVVKYKCTT
ncbi:MAG: hypothetical protein K6E42_08990 [Synergistes sp.]|nr:hypothetical protein [Synergistes sp.]